MPILSSGKEIEVKQHKAPSSTFNIDDLSNLVPKQRYTSIGKGRDASYHPMDRITVGVYLELLAYYDELMKCIAEDASDDQKRTLVANILCCSHSTMDYLEVFELPLNESLPMVYRVFDLLLASRIPDAGKGGVGMAQPFSADSIKFGQIVADLVAVYRFPHSDVMDMEIGWFWNYVANTPAVRAQWKLDMIDAMMMAVIPAFSGDEKKVIQSHVKSLMRIANRNNIKSHDDIQDKMEQERMTDLDIQAWTHHPFMGKFIKVRRRGDRKGN